MVGIEGKVFDVDALKKLAQKSELANIKFPELKILDLKKSEDVGKLHAMVKELGYEDARMEALAKSIMSQPEDRKPNLIFDVTLKDVNKLNEILRYVIPIGYDKKNIHLVWVINEMNIAMEQNQKRSRVVPEKILIATHQGAAKTVSKLVKSKNIDKYIDGDVYFVFNRARIDSVLVSGDSKEVKSKFGGTTKAYKEKGNMITLKPSYIEKGSVLYLHVKQAGKPTKSLNDIFVDFGYALRKLKPNDVSGTKIWFDEISKGMVVVK